MTDLEIVLDYISKQWLPHEVSVARKRLLVELKASRLIPGVPLTDGAGIPEWQRKD